VLGHSKCNSGKDALVRVYYFGEISS